MDNKYSYVINSGKVKGYFNIYQARNGSIQLQMDNSSITLTKEQILKLNINYFELVDYSHEDFQKYYGFRVVR